MAWILCQSVNAEDFSVSKDRPATVAISDAHQPLLPSVIRNKVGYLTVKNTSPKPLQIVGFSSPLFAQVEMHRTLLNDGVASMEKVDSLNIAPGATAFFEAGGLHLMMFGGTQTVKAGDSFPISINLASGESIPFDMRVTSMTGNTESASTAMSAHHHHHEQ